MPKIDTLAILGHAKGYYPSAAVGGNASIDTIYAGRNVWLRPGNTMLTAKGVSQISATSISPRIFPLDTSRGQIAGDYVGTKLPKQGFVRYQLGAYFFVSEETSKQVYVDESALSGVTTSTTAGKLRVAIPASGGGYTTYDAGLEAPILPDANVVEEAGGTKSMNGIVSVVLCARAFGTDSTSNPSNVIQKTLTAGGNNRLRITLHSLTPTGTQQDGWLVGATYWNQGTTGPWKEMRDIRTTIRGTITFTNGSNAVTGSGSRFAYDLRNGDKVRVDGNDYYVQVNSDTSMALFSDATLATAANFPGSTGTYTVTVREVAIDYRNGELGDNLNFTNAPPPLLDGIFLFNGILWGWKGNAVYASKSGNPEAWPQTLLTFAQTQSGADVIAALAGDAQIWLLTKNSAEVVTFTQRDDAPFIVRKVWDFGFMQPNNAAIAEGRLYALVGSAYGTMAVRTQVDDSPDMTFGAMVESVTKNWDLEKSLVTVDPTNKAVLFCNYDSVSDTTTVIPWMLQSETDAPRWSVPIVVAGRITDGAQIGGRCVMPIKTGSNYRANFFEGGSGSSTTGYVVWPFIAGIDGLRSVLKRIQVTGRATSVSVFIAETSAAIPDVSNLANAVATFSLSDAYSLEGEIQTHIPNARLYAVRVDLSGADRGVTKVAVAGFPNTIRQ